MNIRILPKSKRAKNRIREHGEIMTLKDDGFRSGVKGILVESTHKTWSLNSQIQTHWMGWFSEIEADWEMI